MNSHMPPAGPANLPPAVPMHPGRRQSDYHYHVPPQMHHNPYANFHPQYQGHGHPAALHYPPQQYYPPYQPYAYPPRPYSQYSPMVVSSHPHPHPQPTPPAPRQSAIPTPAHTPQLPPTSSTPVSSQAVASPSTPKSSAAVSVSPAPSSSRPSFGAPPPVTQRMPFYPELPWYSKPGEPFPPKQARRRRRRRDMQFLEEPLKLPSREQVEDTRIAENHEDAQEPTVVPPSELATPATSQAPSESDSTQPTTPSSTLPPSSAPRPPAPQTHTRTQTRPVVPIIPATPKIPGSSSSHHKGAPSGSQSAAETVTDVVVTKAIQAESEAAVNDSTTPTETGKSQDSTVEPLVASPTRAAPKSWADLVRTKTSTAATSVAPSTNGAVTNGVNAPRTTTSLGEALRGFSVGAERKISFLEPRGLVNTGNMCYMNSILQVLVFCVPFYDFLDQLGKRAVHNFKSDTPLIDAMIMFMREYNVIDSAASVEQLRMRLKDGELEQYGDPFAPEYVYDVIKHLPRFSTMRRGHQQDAEEFLGFLLEGLHDEAALVMKNSSQNLDATSNSENSSPEASSALADSGWLEVGPKQRAAITRSSGSPSIPTPVTKIFGGQLRSEFRVRGLKPSVTQEPYKPLQLDIGSPQVNSITDALKNLTRSETLSGDFNSPLGSSTATKQVSIETLPPILILHLKRFQYDSSGGTQKIWKRIGYPLELEIPKEVFPPNKRGAMSARGASALPKYRLVSVVYHHGKSASGGHYTVDVRRQEGREWIRMDDTVIRRVRSEEVAEGGSEEDPKVLAAALENHKRDQAAGRNLFEHVGLDEDGAFHSEAQSEIGDTDSQGGWKEVNGTASSSGTNRKWAGVVNGTATPSTTGKRTPRERSGIKDNKVAYILFYQQITA
ncbi:MAG: hypothetical protein M1820_006377 [Bogoriella megaspora]|nr:MAG: hypothetical protein M1820_006377 [Bogoriella megaspora]